MGKMVLKCKAQGVMLWALVCDPVGVEITRGRELRSRPLPLGKARAKLGFSLAYSRP